MAPAETTPHTPRQAELLDHALALVRDGGFAALTTKRLAASVGFTEAAIYRHFPNKQALILGLADRVGAMLLGPAGEIARDERLCVADRLERIVRHHAAIVREHKGLPILLLAEASVSDDAVLLARIRAIFRRYLSLLERLVRDGQAAGELVRDPASETLALMLVGPPAALAIRLRLLPDDEPGDRVGEALVPFLVDAIRDDAGREGG